MKKVAQTQFVLGKLDEIFPIARASELSLDDAFMKHQPIGWVQERVMENLVTRIPLGLRDFRRPRVDPSFDDEGNLVFEEGRRPGVGKLVAFEWKKLFEAYLPEKHSRMATDIDYDVFCGVLIKELVESGWNVERAWYEVCNESNRLGHFWDSKGARDTFERTGSRPQVGWCDLGNTKKIVTNETGTAFLVVSGCYSNSSQMFSIASQEKLCFQDYTTTVSIGLMFMDV